MFTMKVYFSQKSDTLCPVEEDFSAPSLQESIKETRRALDIAYAGFDNAMEFDLIDSYIYEINSIVLAKCFVYTFNYSTICSF